MVANQPVSIQEQVVDGKYGYQALLFDSPLIGTRLPRQEKHHQLSPV